MQWQSGTQNRRDHQLVTDRIDRRDTQRRLHVRLLIMERLTHLHRHELTDTLDITTETKRVLLNLHIAEFPKEHIEHTVLLG